MKGPEIRIIIINQVTEGMYPLMISQLVLGIQSYYHVAWCNILSALISTSIS